jgi:hypothetical protein
LVHGSGCSSTDAGADADICLVRGCLALQRIQILHHIRRHLGRRAVGIGVATPRCDDRMDLDQLSTPIQLHGVHIHTRPTIVDLVVVKLSVVLRPASHLLG